MSRVKLFFLSVNFILIHLQVSGQAMPTQEALNTLILKSWNQVDDYEVDIKLSLNIPGFRMPSRKIHYFYKAPDKSKVEVKGFAIIPKQGIQPFFTFLNDSLDLTIVADTSFNGKLVYEVALKDTFMNRAGQIGFYIDKETGSIYEAWAIHNTQRFFNLSNDYISVDGIYLPSETRIEMIFPPDFKNIQRLGKKPAHMKAFDKSMTDEWLEGSIKIKFSNYEVNKGLPDYLFEDNEEDLIQD